MAEVYVEDILFSSTALPNIQGYDLMKSHDGSSVSSAKPEVQFTTMCKVASGKDLGTGIPVTNATLQV